jgi:Mg2+-importing ATPase
LLARLRSGADGLASADAALRLRRHGPNALRPRARLAALRLLLRQFESPLVAILVFAAGIAALVGDWTDAAIVLVILLGSALLGFFQEYRASAVMERLRARVRARASVLRDGRPTTLLPEQIVPGDVVLLAAGSLIPADGVVLEARDLFVTQAALTGEAFPVEKQPGTSAPAATLAERTHCVFMGTSVRSGTGRALIVETGAATAYGAIAERPRLRPPETDFERGIRQYGYLLMRIMLVLVALVFAANVFLDRPPVESLLFALALAVGISPELLPAIIEITLARGARDMAAHGAIVRRLTAIESLGGMDVLCTDKTGTLTEGVLALASACDAAGAPSDAVLHLAAWNASLETGLPSPLDDAILEAARTRDLRLDDAAKLDEIPYDFVRKRLSVVVQPAGTREALLVTKGAFANVLEACTHLRDGTAQTALDAAARERLESRFAAWSRQGHRVLAVATRSLPVRARYERGDESSMTFEGFLLFLDPPKAGIADTLGGLERLGVSIKVITGDNRLVTAHLAEAIGIDGSRIVSGRELAQLSDDALTRVAAQRVLFVEVDPNQKERIILALRKLGHVVGFLGDGINDAPALHAADVGISVDQAVDVAKEAADIVLLEHDLEALRRGIEQGRASFANTLKYLAITTSANFGNMVSMAAASLFLPFLPLLAKQILLNNLLSDIPAMAIPGDRVDQERVARPGRWQIGPIRNFMLVFGLISSAFDGLTFAALWWLTRGDVAAFRTGWFVESLLTELVIVLVVRTRLPLLRSRPSTPLLAATLAVSALALALPWLPGREAFEFVPLPGVQVATLLAITAGYAGRFGAGEAALRSALGSRLRIPDQHRPLRDAGEPSLVLDLDAHDRGGPGERDDLRLRRDLPLCHRGQQVQLELGGGRPLAALHVRVTDAAEHVVADGGEHAAVQVLEGRQQLVAHLELRAQHAGAELGEAHAEEGGQALELLVRPQEPLGDLRVVGFDGARVGHRAARLAPPEGEAQPEADQREASERMEGAPHALPRKDAPCAAGAEGKRREPAEGHREVDSRQQQRVAQHRGREDRELGQQRQVEDAGVRVQRVREEALHEGVPPLRCRARLGRRRPAPARATQRPEAERDQVRGAREAQRAEGGRRGRQQRRDAERRERRVQEQPRADAGGGRDAGARAGEARVPEHEHRVLARREREQRSQ